ncbi:MAG: flippase-like domain-containing protein [Bacteroidetes bacterium]|nr:flippase-like domain-containing protein [Bacteroidota bacterium]
MIRHKKILSIVLKIAIGLASFLIVYFRLKGDLTSDNLQLLYNSVFSFQGAIILFICLLLIPVNWGLETYKWQLVTAPVEKVSFKKATQSVYSGICLGNLAPGRATEFIAKIIFFKPENRPQITVLHFINGMFQLCVTYLIGFIALAYKVNSFGDNYLWIAYTAISTAVLVILVFIISLVKIDAVLNFITRRISKKQNTETRHEYKFTRVQLLKLFGLSLLRYFVFYFQMVIIMKLFAGNFNADIALGIALYFLITTTIPMISFLEAAIRAAVAIVVFKGTGLSNAGLALSSVAVWLINIIIPSIAGYFILIRQNFDFKFYASKK